jgi:PAS domain S-box-containing protein
VHFDTADDFPFVVEVRIPESFVLGLWARQLLVPIAVLLLTLVAISLYVGLVLRFLRERTVASQEVATQERRLRNILDTAVEGIVTIDEKGFVREFNRAAEEIFGVPATEAVGRPFTDVLPSSMADHQGRVERYLRTGEARIIGKGRFLQMVRRDGRAMEIHLAVSEVVVHGERIFTGFVRDVTDVRQAEERFRTLFQRSGEPHLLLDSSGIADCNDAALRLLGAETHHDVQGRSLHELAAAEQVVPGLQARAVLENAIAEAQREGVKRVSWSVRTLGGLVVPVEMTLTPIRIGAERAMLVSWHDVSERLRHEAELRRARDAAEAAANAKSSFLATMSHEIRTPMTGILGMADLLEDTGLSPQQKRLVDVLSTSAHSLLRVLDDVLDYSKLEAGRLTVESIDFDPGAGASEVLDLLSAGASARGNTLRRAWDPDALPRLRGDPVRIRQVLVNLVGNASKFTSRGTVTLAIEAAPLDADGKVRIRYEVRDTGVGIAPAVLPTLFRPFQQADGSTTRRFGGTGLGLAICRRLVDAMGGEIGVESREGAGSTFWFELRLPPGEAERPAPAPPAADVPALRVLLAEDNAVNRMLICARLRRDGHTVDVAVDGREALRAVEEQEYDVVLMDMQMPEMDGAEATRRIRMLAGARGRTPVVGLSADALPVFRRLYMDAGLDDYVTKPVDWAALDAVLRRVAPQPRSAS